MVSFEIITTYYLYNFRDSFFESRDIEASKHLYKIVFSIYYTTVLNVSKYNINLLYFN